MRHPAGVGALIGGETSIHVVGRSIRVLCVSRKGDTQRKKHIMGRTAFLPTRKGKNFFEVFLNRSFTDLPVRIFFEAGSAKELWLFQTKGNLLELQENEELSKHHCRPER